MVNARRTELEAPNAKVGMMQFLPLRSTKTEKGKTQAKKLYSFKIFNRNILMIFSGSKEEPRNSAQLGSPEIVRYCEVLRYFASRGFRIFYRFLWRSSWDL